MMRTRFKMGQRVDNVRVLQSGFVNYRGHRGTVTGRRKVPNARGLRRVLVGPVEYQVTWDNMPPPATSWVGPDALRLVVEMLDTNTLCKPGTATVGRRHTKYLEWDQ